MQIVVRICHVIMVNAKIPAKIMSAAPTLYVKLKINRENVNAQPVSKEIHCQNRDVFEYHQHVFQRADALTVTCASEIFAKCRAQITLPVPSAKDATIMFVQRFATQITTVCRVKFVTNAERVNRVV